MKQLTIAQNFSRNCFTEFLKLSMLNNTRAQFHNSRTCQFLGVLPKHVIFCLILITSLIFPRHLQINFTLLLPLAK